MGGVTSGGVCGSGDGASGVGGGGNAEVSKLSIGFLEISLEETTGHGFSDDPSGLPFARFSAFSVFVFAQTVKKPIVSVQPVRKQKQRRPEVIGLFAWEMNRKTL